MNAVNKTLYIPLYGKAYVSEKGLFLRDDMAEHIWAAQRFTLKGKAKSKWLAYYMGMRAAVFDEWVRNKMSEFPEAAIVHVGCGLDSRVLRVGTNGHDWYDVDFAEVIAERRHYFEETADYHMIGADLREHQWLDAIHNTRCAIVVMEGVSMYVTNEELRTFMEQLREHFEEVVLLMDCYTELAVRMSSYKNPVRDVGVEQLYSVDEPRMLQSREWSFVQEHAMTPEYFIHELRRIERYVFQRMYAGRLVRKLYRLFEYKKK